LELVISPILNGGAVSDLLFWKFEGKQIFVPRDKVYRPKLEYVQWHNQEVYCG
jgi:predicted restriction endonuclease